MNNGSPLPNPVGEDGAYDPTKYISIVKLENRHLGRHLEEANWRNAEFERTREQEIPRKNKVNLGTQPRARGSLVGNRQCSSQTQKEGARTNPGGGNEMNHTKGRRTGREKASVASRHTITHSRSMGGGENTRRNNDQEGIDTNKAASHSRTRSMSRIRSMSGMISTSHLREHLNRNKLDLRHNLVQSKGIRSNCK
uniref:Uncharacterized protein n=1 Tax=Cannabis sativa TaxID=3483 RepID=A0A803PD16_CANSA